MQNDEAMGDGENQIENIEEDKETREQDTHVNEQEQEHDEKPNNEPNHVQQSTEEADDEEEEKREENHVQEAEVHDLAPHHADDTPNVIDNVEEPPKNSDQVSFNR